MTHPLPVFQYEVDWGGTRTGFSEVSGLDIEVQSIEYREGNSREYSAIKMPGLRKYENITLKRGIVPGDNEFFNWLETARLNQVERRDITISLLNEEHTPVMVWKVRNAWVTKLVGPHLDATANEIAIESIELAHDGLSIETN
jgi:phage tail-like protein